MTPAASDGSQSIEAASETRATIGESPLWSPAERALYWMDIKAPSLRRFYPSTGAERAWPLTSDIGGFGLLPGGEGAVVALRYGIFTLDFASGDLTKLADPPFDPTLFRFNEGACDRTGRFWIGVMFDPLEPTEPKQPSHLHSFTLSGGLREEDDRSALHNGMAWSADGGTFYLAHSYDQTISTHVFDPTAGAMGEGRLFARLPKECGIPDGAAVDANGGYWSACHGGGRLRRYLPDGSVDRDIELPVSQPTMCAFGGEDLQTLYVTSARDGLSDTQLAREPLAGALLRLRPGVRGLHTHPYVR